MRPGNTTPLLAALLGLVAACGPSDTAAVEVAPLRANLFGRMAEAELTGLPEAGGAAAEPRRHAFDFDASEPGELWFAREKERGPDFEDLDEAFVAVDAEGGLAGGALRLGPDLAEDRSYAALVLPSTGLARVTVRGRVRLENNPMSGEASSREVLRVAEHDRVVEDPSKRRGGRYRWGPRPHRVSRRIEPSGWDRFELTFITQASTQSLELRLLHRSGGDATAVTRFDDLEVEEVALSDHEILEHLRGRYRPKDGNEDATPWRVRVSLRTSDRGRSEVRDAVLLPPPATLALPVEVPAAETKPRLRFRYAMAPEAFSAPGDGARIAVAFRGEDGAEQQLSEVAFDPKGDEKSRHWMAHAVDLTAVASRRGHLVFASHDADGEPDPMDLVLLATPRIEPAEQAPDALNVLLIGVDTLRPDKMSAFGYERPTTPRLKALADEGVRFPNTRSQAPWTLPSFSSIQTSLYPSAHGAGRGGHDEWTPIDPTTTSLAELLSRVGYETVGIVANGLISPSYGLDQGFESYQSDWSMESGERDAPWVARFVEEHRTTPWFLFWHIMDPHLPYMTEDSFHAAFTEEGYEGRFKRGRHNYVPFEVLDPRPGRRWFAHEGAPPPPDLEEEDVRYVHDYYDAEIAEMDAAVGQVFDAIEASGQWDRTVVAFVADHGEGLGDHDHYHHGYTLFDDQVRIPMILRAPGGPAGLTIDRPVASIDLAPTLLGALGMESPDFFQGVDRLAEDAPAEDAYFVEYPTYDSSAQKAWILGDFKYLHDPVFRTEALYHLGDDPGETRDVKEEHPDVVVRARTALDAFRWEQLQKGRYHLRVRGSAGARLRVSITTDDLFDANFACRPMQPEADFAMDQDRRSLVLDTEMTRDRVELVFWCRGSEIEVDASLDGSPLRGGLALAEPDGDAEPEAVPRSIATSTIPIAQSREVRWPRPGRAVLWQETGAAQVLPVVPTPEEIELLNQLGYTR